MAHACLLLVFYGASATALWEESRLERLLRVRRDGDGRTRETERDVVFEWRKIPTYSV